MMLLGQYLTDIGSLSPDDFNEVVGAFLLKRAARVIGQLETLLVTRKDDPTLLLNDVLHQIESLQSAMLQPSYMLPSDLGGKQSLDGLRSLVQTLLKQFGQLLYWWPDITNGVKLLRDRGEKLGGR